MYRALKVFKLMYIIYMKSVYFIRMCFTKIIMFMQIIENKILKLL